MEHGALNPTQSRSQIYKQGWMVRLHGVGPAYLPSYLARQFEAAFVAEK